MLAASTSFRSMEAATFASSRCSEGIFGIFNSLNELIMTFPNYKLNIYQIYIPEDSFICWTACICSEVTVLTVWGSVGTFLHSVLPTLPLYHHKHTTIHHAPPQAQLTIPPDLKERQWPPTTLSEWTSSLFSWHFSQSSWWHWLHKSQPPWPPCLCMGPWSSLLLHRPDDRLVFHLMLMVSSVIFWFVDFICCKYMVSVPPNPYSQTMRRTSEMKGLDGVQIHIICCVHLSWSDWMIEQSNWETKNALISLLTLMSTAMSSTDAWVGSV